MQTLSGPLQADNSLLRFPSPDDESFELVVPVQLLEEYSVFKRRAFEQLADLRRNKPSEQSRCVYCWVAASSKDIEQIEQITELIISTDFYSACTQVTRSRGNSASTVRAGCRWADSATASSHASTDSQFDLAFD